MPKTYSYDPNKIVEDGPDKMRFQLGDTAIEGGAETCPLCDEEYCAIIGSSRSWITAKIICLEAICSKMAYEVDYSADGLSFSLSQRYARWKDMLADAQRGRQVPAVNSAALGQGRNDGGHYFYAGMLNNPFAAGSEK